MSLSLSLANALSGLHAAQASISTISNNITNVNTKGYSREILPQTSLVYDGIGHGVQTQTVISLANQYLNADINNQTSILGQSQALDTYLKKVLDLIGSPNQGSTIGNYYNTFANTLKSLSTTPEDTNLQTQAVQAAKNLTAQLNQTSKSLQQIRSEAVSDIGSSVSQINLALTKIDTFNAQITRAKALGQSTAALEDQRQTALNDLANHIDITTFTRTNGDVAVHTRSGQVLVDNGAKQLDYTAPSSLSSTSSTGAITLGGRDLTKSGLTSGRLAGLIDIVNDKIPAITDQLNNFATALYSQTIDPSGRLQTTSAAAPTTGHTSFQADVKGTGFTAGQTITQSLQGPPPTTATATIASVVPSQMPGYSTLIFTMSAGNGTLYGGPATIGGVSSQVIGLAKLDPSVVTAPSAGNVQGTIANGSSGVIDIDNSAAVTVTDPFTGQPKWSGLTVTNVSADPNNPGHQTIDVINKSGADIAFNFNSVYSGARVERVSGQSPPLNAGQFFSNVLLSPTEFPADAASTITVSAALDSTLGGAASRLNLQNDPNALNNSNYANIAQTLSDQLLSSNKINFNKSGSGALTIASGKYDIKTYLTNIVSTSSSYASSASSHYQFQKQYTTTLTTQAASVSGVSLDEELGNLTLYQNSYAASAKCMTAASKLFDSLMNILS